MKNLFIVLLAFSCVSFAASKFVTTNPPIAAYVDGISTWWGCGVPNDLGLPKDGQTVGYNNIILSFWISNSAPADAALVWSNLPGYIPDNCGYGSDVQTMQKTLINKFHANGINVLVAAFGATDYPTGEDPTQVCSKLAQFVIDNNLDGVDLDYEDSAAFNANGDGEKWLITCTQVLRQRLPEGQYLLTHAPQGPYFTTDALYPQGSYLKIDREVGSLIDWYNLQYYNQGGSTYVSYQDLVVACKAFPGTALAELKLNSKQGVAVGKPVTTGDASNGWVDPKDLVLWLQKAKSEFGWCGGAMYWQLNHDVYGSFGNTLKKGLSACPRV